MIRRNRRKSANMRLRGGAPAPRGVGSTPGVPAGEPEIDVREGLFHLVHDQTEQAEVGEHALEERLAPGAADLQESRDPAPDPVPARHEVTVLGPREYPWDRAQG